MAEIKRIPKEEVEKARHNRDFEQFKAEQRSFAVLTMTRSYTAPLNSLADAEMSKDTAKKVFAEVMKIAHKISDRFDFSLSK